MRRASIILLLVAVAALLVWRLAPSGSSSYRFAAVFDSARGLVPGQQVKIAGAVVGSIDVVQLTRSLDARIVMDISRRFAPLRADASCTVLPEGLISENFVECNPGRAGAPLARGADGIPVVRLAHTTVPFSVQDVLNVFSLPTDDRLRVLISELGIATAGRGRALNGLLLRADPALEQSRAALAIVNAQRQQLATAVAQTSTVLAQLSRRQADVRRFVDNTASVLDTTAGHRAALSAAVAGLPGMLRAVRPGLRSLNRATTNATSLLDDLRSAAPGLGKLTQLLPSFASTGIPALRALRTTTSSTLAAVRDTVPFVSRLLTATRPLKPLSSDLDELLVSLRGDGAIEGVLRLFYELAVETAMYDNVSHIASFLVNVDPQCILADEAETNRTGCSHRYSDAGGGALPINEPSCGAKSGSWFNEYCAPVAPGPFVSRRQPAAQHQVARAIGEALSGHPPTAAQVRPLLNFLLK